MTHTKEYQMTLKGDETVVAFLKRHIPTKYNRLGVARKNARAIKLIFPGVAVDVFSIDVKPDVGVMKRL